jgi:nucleolysin TIA-1/TIAR
LTVCLLVCFLQSPPTNTTVYIGNLSPDTTEQHLREVFSEFGFIEEIRMQKDKGYAFVRSHTLGLTTSFS